MVKGDPPVEVRVGDAGLVISFLFTDASRKLGRDLTGYSGWVAWWNNGESAPHFTYAGVVDPATAKLIYTVKGSEFTAAGDCFAQPTIAPPDWYGGNATGRSHHMTSGDIVRFIVKAVPV